MKENKRMRLGVEKFDKGILCKNCELRGNCFDIASGSIKVEITFKRAFYVQNTY